MNTEKRIDICCVAKNENLTIRDWVNHHISIGIHHIWIFDNNDPDDMSLNETLKGEIESGNVTVLDLFKGAKSFQILAYNLFLCLHNYKDEYDWVGFIDCDEYVDFNNTKYKNIGEYFASVERLRFKPTAVFINWEIYGSCGQYFYEDKPVVERFPEPTKEKIKFWAGGDENWHIKSFVKAGADGQYLLNPHNCITNGETYDGDLNPVNPKSPWNTFYSYNNVKIKHFQTKSMEEYIIRKYPSICADNKNNRPYTLEYYWDRNKKTPEALEALEVLKKKYHVL